MWPTPTASLTNYSEDPESFNERKALYKEKGLHNGTPLTVACREHPETGPPAPQETGQLYDRACTRRLNPLFVEWLMGFPEGWTASEPSETPSSPSKQP